METFDTLEGEQLDYWVARALGYLIVLAGDAGEFIDDAGDADEPPPPGTERSWRVMVGGDQAIPFCPSTDLRLGGELLDLERISTKPFLVNGVFYGDWEATSIFCDRGNHWARVNGPTRLIAGMRAIVAAYFDEEEGLPDGGVMQVPFRAAAVDTRSDPHLDNGEVRVFVDMDGVLADFEKRKTEMNTTGDFMKLVPGVYLDLDPIEGALSGIRSLIGMGYDVYIATKPPTGLAFAYADKVSWVLNHLPELKTKIIITHDKGLLGTADDFLIDDRPHKANCEQFAGTLIPFKDGMTWADVVERFRRLSRPNRDEVLDPRETEELN